MKYVVTAICIKRLMDDNNEPTGEYTMPNELEKQHPYVRMHGVVQKRDEIVDTIENEIFKDCKNEYDVEDHYEYFWNRLNGGYTNSEIVKVLNVVATK